MTLCIKGLSRLSVGPVSFAVAPGECVAITGASGSGKSLLLRSIVDLDVNQGEVTVDGQARSRTPAPQWRRTVTYLASESGWWDESVGAHFPIRGSGLTAALSRLGFDDEVLAWPVSRCSSGERQRLALLRGLCHEPAYLLLDEPTSALDPDSTAAAEALLRSRRDAGVGMVLVTHEPAQIARFGARHLILEDGQLHPAQPEGLV